MAKKFSQFPFASSINPGDSIVGLKDGANTRFSFATIFSYIQSLFVPTSRKVNNKALSSDITLDASDVGAVDTADVGEADGVASLDSNGKVPGTQLDLSGKQDKITANGILKGDGAGGVTAATAGTDYATPAQLEGKANQPQIAYVQDGTTASRSYAVGRYFCMGGLLYRVTAAIPNGGTITPDTNCVAVTVGGMNDLANVISSINGNSSITLNVPYFAAGLIATARSTTGHVSLASVTAASVTELVSSASITYSLSGNTLTISNATPNPINLYIFNFANTIKITVN